MLRRSYVWSGVILFSILLLFGYKALAQDNKVNKLLYDQQASISADDILRLAIDTASETITIVQFLKEDSSNLTFRKYYFVVSSLGYDLKIRSADTILSPSPLPPVYIDIWPASHTLMISDADGYEASFYDNRQHKWLALPVRMPIRHPNFNLFVRDTDVWLVPKQPRDGLVYRMTYPFRVITTVRIANPGWATRYGQLMWAELLPSPNGPERALLTYMDYGKRLPGQPADPTSPKLRLLDVQLRPSIRLIGIRDSILLPGIRPLPWNHEFALGDQQVMVRTAIGCMGDSAVVLSSNDFNQPLVKWPLASLMDISGRYRPDWFCSKILAGKPPTTIAKSEGRLRKTQYMVGRFYAKAGHSITHNCKTRWFTTDVIDWPAPIMMGAIGHDLTAIPSESLAITYAMGETLKQIVYPDDASELGQVTQIKPKTPADKWTKSAKILEFWDLGRGRLLWMKDLKRHESQGGRLVLKQQYLLGAGMMINDR